MGDEWYRHWFGEAYLQVYHHRDREEAHRFVDTILERVPVPDGGCVLDVACGIGRHALTFAERGYRVVGVDLSLPLLRRGQEMLREVREAREDSDPVYLLLGRADMRRLPFRGDGGTADLVLNLFTAFGYFATEEEDARSLVEMAAALKDAGTLILDFMNRRHLMTRLKPDDSEYREGLHILQERRLTDLDRRIEKTITLTSADGRVETFTETVRLYAPDDLDRLARQAGLEPVAWWGDYDGAPFEEGSPRCILIARRTAGARSGQEHA